MNPLQLACLAAAMELRCQRSWRPPGKCTAHRSYRLDRCVLDLWNGIVAAFCSLAPLPTDHWPGARQFMVAALVALWSLRLGGHILLRTREAGDDPRYRN